MSNKLLTRIHTGLIRALGRDRLEYLASNTMNALTQRVDPFIWSFECQAKIIEIRRETAGKPPTPRPSCCCPTSILNARNRVSI